MSKIWGILDTGNSLSEALILASTNPQYDSRLFIELWVQYMKIARSKHVVYKNCFFAFVLTFKTLFVHCMFYTCIFREFNEQSLVILWVVNWFKNESFWHRFICIGKKWIKKKYLNKFLPSSSQPWLSKEYCNLNKAARFKATSWI